MNNLEKIPVYFLCGMTFFGVFILLSSLLTSFWQYIYGKKVKRITFVIFVLVPILPVIGIMYLTIKFVIVNFSTILSILGICWIKTKLFFLEKI